MQEHITTCEEHFIHFLDGFPIDPADPDGKFKGMLCRTKSLLVVVKEVDTGTKININVYTL